MSGIGADIGFANRPSSGVIGLFLNDDAGAQYALTCAHVLDQPAGRQPVQSKGSGIGQLSCRIPIVSGMAVDPVTQQQIPPNQVDSALIRMWRSNHTNHLPDGLGMVNGIAAVQPGAEVSIVNKRKTVTGTVITTAADLRLPYRHGWVYFSGMITATGAESIQPGDSGSLVLDKDNMAVGLVMAISENAVTIGSNPKNLGTIIVVSDIQRIISHMTSYSPCHLRGLGLRAPAP